MASISKSASTFANIAGAGPDWVSKSVSIPPNTGISDLLSCSGFAFAIPSNAVIDGIQVTINGNRAPNAVSSHRIYAKVLGVVANPAESPFTDVNSNVNFGSSTTKWTAAPTVADLNSGAFNVEIAGANYDTFYDMALTISTVQVTVYYTEIIESNGAAFLIGCQL